MEEVVNRSDKRECKRAYGSMQRKCTDCKGRCDCNDSEIVMLSTGYATVFRVGHVVSHGRLLYDASVFE